MTKRKGEIAFSTFVSLVIVAAVLIVVLVWLLPNYSDIFKKTDAIQESAGVTDEAILKIKCERLCKEAQSALNENKNLNPNKIGFCTEGCKGAYICEGVSC